MFEGKEVKVILAQAGAGKGNWVECKIPTPTGIRRFGDIQKGDFVYDRYGNPTKVLDVYKRGFLEAYKVTLSDGRSTVVSFDHLWNVYKGASRKEQTMELAEMLECGIRKEDKRENRKLGRPNFYIPKHFPQQKKEQEVSVNPFVFGAFIGNGCLTSRYLEFSSNDEETVRKISQIMGFTYKKNSAKNFTWTFYKNNKKVETKEYFEPLLSKDKFIPECYKQNSLDNRYLLLQGLFDTDGSAATDGTRLKVSYSSVSAKLITDIKELLISVGIVSHIREDKRQDRNICYELTVNTSKENKCKLFSLQRKLQICLNAKESKRDYNKIAIRSVEKLPNKLEINCIYVDNEEHLYQCDEGIVTHNTHRLIGEIEKELLTRRPEEIAFVTFTKKGAEEGLRRVCNKFNLTPDDLPYFRTLHSLTFHALDLKANQMFSKLDQRKFNKEYGYNLNRSETNTKKVSPTRDSLYLDYYDLERSGALTSKQIAEADIEIAYYRQLVQKYEEYKSSLSLVDFFDCLLHYVQVGETLPAKVVFVDEAQDLTLLQWKVVEKAFSKAEKVILAGDDSQALYKYSGARPDILIHFAKNFDVEYLSSSYRIPRKVYELAKSVVAFIGEKADKPFDFREENEEGKIYELSCIGRLINFIDLKLEDSNKTQWYILSRNNCFLPRIYKELEDNLIPYWTADGFFMGGEIMKRLVDYENFKLDGYRSVDKKEKFQRKFGIEDFNEPFTETNLFTEERKYVYASYIEKYGLPLLQKMCKWNPQLLVSTIHGVKGGEADNVALLLSATKKTKANIFNDIDDELRVLYVGITRTKKNLFLIDSENENGFNNIIQTIKEENGLVW